MDRENEEVCAASFFTLPLRGRVDCSERSDEQSGWGDGQARQLIGSQMAKPITEFRRQTAHRLRVSATQPEQKLWRALKRVPTFGSHFRRQAPIGRYVVDFACMRAKLVVELDGGHHSDDKVAAKDAMRTRWLEGQGYKVLRFWNAELNSNLDGVLDTIHAAL